jgi:putative DNA methylase
MHPIKSPKKLIEVALPLDDINIAAAREKSIRHGHPSTLHLWWSRKPTAAARAVLFAQLVNDPGYETGQGFSRGVGKGEAARERERLFDIIRKLVRWENTNKVEVLEAAREEIRKSWRETCHLNRDHPQAAELFDPDKLPAFHDPFAGGGAIPLEAQRLGLESHASDLNPVAVLINKAMIEIPPKFAGRVPVGPVPVGEKQGKLAEDWSGARGLAEDVRRYGHWMREEADKRIGHLYPKVEITAEMATKRPDLKSLVGSQLTVVAWLWARTVRSPNPAYSDIEVPLIPSFLLSAKPKKEAWVNPIVSGRGYSFEICTTSVDGNPPSWVKDGTKISQGYFRCLMSDTPIKYEYVDAEANAGRMGVRLMAIVAEGVKDRIYLEPSEYMEAVARSAQPAWRPDSECRGTFASNAQGRRYGFKTFGDYFSERQLVALTTFSELVLEAQALVYEHAVLAGMMDDGRSLDDGGVGATAYSEAVAVYLALGLSRLTDISNALCRWESTKTQVRNLFGMQAIPMNWAFAENNIFGGAAGDYATSLGNLVKALANMPAQGMANALQRDAGGQDVSAGKVISSDPPYYDNVGYADLSDFFYVWLRRSLRPIYPDLFATVAAPKAQELIATPYRHGSKEVAEKFFLEGMTAAMRNIAELANEAFPVTIYYAFKQSETKDAGTASTGWETFLAAVLKAGFMLTGTWPMRTELVTRRTSLDSNSLASCVVLVCRKRPTNASIISRKDFLRELKSELREALEAMLGAEGGASAIAPVDLAQAAIGPGMSVFSRYAAVLEANGEPMSVHTALTLINKQVDETLGGENFDADTNFCLGWFQDVGWSAGAFGQADVLARAKGTSVEAVEKAGVIDSRASKVRLLKPADYDTDWDPRYDNRTPVWEALHQLIRALNQGGESAAGALLARMPERSGDIRRLAFWLYTLCERKGWAEDARNYNELVTAWHAIETASHEVGELGAQGALDI